MDSNWNLFNNTSSSRRGQNSNFNNVINHAWGGTWEVHGDTNPTSRVISDHWSTNLNGDHWSTTGPTCMGNNASSCYFPDPHLTSLKLGKRHYFENATPLTGAFDTTKKGNPFYEHGGGKLVGTSTSVAAPPVVPRCQVEGCCVVLVKSKEYHKRHKVCEVHSKAPKVMVHGVEQRFCQQCSRFHALSEFDDSKRSCRRRLAGHNERRRKNSQDHLSSSAPTNLTQDDRLIASTMYPYLPLNSSSALSLLSSKSDSWTSSSTDLSAQCSAALRELIAENRASVLAGQLSLFDRPNPFLNEPSHQVQNPSGGSFESCPGLMGAEPSEWENANAGTHLTLDLKQTPSSEFGYLSMQGKGKDEECSELWGAFKGTRVL